MATLETDVKTRYSSQRIIDLTNPDKTAATTIDDTRLSAAATDVKADFDSEVGLQYDPDDATHVSVAVEGVVAKLMQRSAVSSEFGGTAHGAYLTRLRGLRERVEPVSSSELTPTDEKRGQAVVRPDFDRRKFDDFKAESPGTGVVVE